MLRGKWTHVERERERAKIKQAATEIGRLERGRIRARSREQALRGALQLRFNASIRYCICVLLWFTDCMSVYACECAYMSMCVCENRQVKLVLNTVAVLDWQWNSLTGSSPGAAAREAKCDATFMQKLHVFPGHSPLYSSLSLSLLQQDKIRTSNRYVRCLSYDAACSSSSIRSSKLREKKNKKHWQLFY